MSGADYTRLTYQPAYARELKSSLGAGMTLHLGTPKILR